MGTRVDCLLLLSPWRELFWLAIGGIVFPLLCLAAALAREALSPPPRAASDPSAIPAAGHDEIELIEGIGPEIAALLRDHGIDTFEAIASLTAGQLRYLLLKDPDLSLAQPSTWPFQARLLADGRFGDFNRLATALEGGVPRLENIDGIGEGYARRLRAGGIETVAELQRSSAARIAGVFAEGDRDRIAAMAPRWIDHARRLHEGDPGTLSTFARLGAPAAALVRDDPPPALRPAPDRDGAVASYWRRENRLRLLCAPLLALALLILLLLLALLGLLGDRGRCRIVGPWSTPSISVVVVPVAWPPGTCPVPGQVCCAASGAAQACPQPQPGQTCCSPSCAAGACPEPRPPVPPPTPPEPCCDVEEAR